MTTAERRYRAKETPEQRLRLLARTQWGVVSRAQACAVGLGEGAIDRRLQAETWTLLYPGVYLVTSNDATWRQRLLGAQIWAGQEACISHRSAAAVWEIFDAPADIVELTTVSRTRRQGVIVHYRSSPTPSVRKGPLRVTTPTRTLVDLASVIEPKRLESAVYSALRQRLTAVPVLQDQIEKLGRGCRGVGALRRILREAQGLQGIPESELETRFLDFLRRFDLPRPHSQFRVNDRDGNFVARVDFAYPDLKIAIEVDGFRYHSEPRHLDRDRERLSALAVEDWRVLHVTHRDIDGRSAIAAKRIHDLIGGRQLSFRSCPR